MKTKKIETGTDTENKRKSESEKNIIMIVRYQRQEINSPEWKMQCRVNEGKAAFISGLKACSS